MRSKKGFTLVELLIVIAILAILATVAIVGYTSFIDKANQSVDEQAVTQINTALEALEITDGKFENVSEVIIALADMDLEVEDYRALKSGMYFYWVEGLNRVIYADEDDNVVYPEKVDESYKNSTQNWFSLSGIVPMKGGYYDSTEGETTTVSIANGKQLAHFMEKRIPELMADSTVKNINITLTGDINLMGSTSSFGIVKDKIINLDGRNHTISGMRIDRNSLAGVYDNQQKNYGFALFNYVEENATVNVSNLTISGAIIENTAMTKSFGQSAVLFGGVYGVVKAEGVTIDGCTVYGGDKAGAVIGALKGTATLTDVTVKNTEVYGFAYVAKIVGCLQAKPVITLSNISCDNVTVGFNPDAWDIMYAGVTDMTNPRTNKPVTPNDVQAYKEGSTNTYLPNLDGKYLMGITTEDYYWSFVIRGSVTVNGYEYKDNVATSSKESYTGSN